MLARIGVKKFLEWEAYAALEPFDELRADLRAASIREAIYNVNRDSKKHPKPFPLVDFLLKFGEQIEEAPQKKPWSEINKTLKLIAAVYAKPKPKRHKSS